MNISINRNVGKMDEKLLIEVIDGLLKYKLGFIRSTKKFKSMKHNKDILPSLEEKFKMILDCFNKFQKVVYDIQGIGDQGSDMLIRFGQKNFDKYIAMQIKSYTDIEKDDYLDKLRLQYADTCSNFGEKLLHYYILLCTDDEEHQNKIRQINNKFSKITDVTVIDSKYMITFIQHSQFRIMAYVEYLAKIDDVVYKNAIKVTDDLTPTEISIILSMVYNFIEYGKRKYSSKYIFDDQFIKELFLKIPDREREYYFVDDSYESGSKQFYKKNLNRKLEDRINIDLEYLEDNYFWINNSTGEYEIDVKYFKPLISIMLDSQIRYEYEKADLLKFVFNLLRVSDRYNLKIEI